MSSTESTGQSSGAASSSAARQPARRGLRSMHAQRACETQFDGNRMSAITDTEPSGTFRPQFNAISAMPAWTTRISTPSLPTATEGTRAIRPIGTSKLAALYFYQLSIPAPKAPSGSYGQAAFE
jgi:hypothetical protein